MVRDLATDPQPPDIGSLAATPTRPRRARTSSATAAATSAKGAQVEVYGAVRPDP